ncbi:MAG TPA: DNA methyltransferase [Polyangiaceae bacterium]|nr:DNA methyltransferase [Polyangiaceae bacterium]
MGYHVVRLDADAVCLRPSRVWLSGDEVVAEKPATRAKWLQETTGMAKGQAEKLHKALGATKKPVDALETLAEYAVSDRDGTPNRRAAGSLVIQPGPERRRTSSHYTPRSLTAPIVAKTLEPLFGAMGEHPPSERILNLKVCDPAMGSGAFLVEACRYLADQVVLAWTREGRHDLLAGSEDATLIARRLVAQRCLYGVDKNAYAVNLAKLSLWLVTLAKDLPFTFVDHALRHGDSLVGLSFDQITAFHWKPRTQVELCATELKATLDEAIAARQRILDLAADASPAAQKDKEWLLKDAEDALERVRLIGDLVVGAFFAADKDKEREKERDRRLDLVLAWLRDGGPPDGELLELRAEIRARVPVFHWMAEYPEVFWVNRPDPLDGDKQGGAAWIDAFVGNPPFLGGTRISSVHSVSYRDWLADSFSTSGNTDLAAFFFRRVFMLLGDKGAAGMIATNTINQGDTRASGLAWICGHGANIYYAETNKEWDGDVGVSVSVVCFALNITALSPVINGSVVGQINSYLSQRGGESTPVSLAANRNLPARGNMVMGSGFVFEDGKPDSSPLTLMREICERDPRSRERIHRYVGGEDFNSDPEQSSNRFVIDFGELGELDARLYSELFNIVEEKVKPARASVAQRDRREQWWRHANRSPVFREYVTRHGRALAGSRVSAHHAFAFVSSDVVLADSCVIILLSSHSSFAVIQCRIHEGWATFNGSSLQQTRRYTPTECLETFPFPHRLPDESSAELELIGQQLYDTRAAYMIATQQGLTQTYNRLKDPDCLEHDIVALRELHLELDRAVLAAYGWTDLIPLVPAYTTPRTDDEKRAVAAFEDAVIDRLFALNAERAAQERAAEAAAVPAAGTGKPKRGAKRSKSAASNAQLPLGSQDD